jgi:hypothetical protein
MSSSKVPMIWIISTINSECAECGTHCKRGSHVLWLPESPRGENNLCRQCGETRATYPGPAYWQRREEKLNDAEAKAVHG